jgi:hypothetical protein
MDEAELKALVEGRNDVDYEAYQLLSEMESDGVLVLDCLVSGLRRVDSDLTITEANEMAQHYVETFADLQKRRKALDQAIVRAGVQ